MLPMLAGMFASGASGGGQAANAPQSDTVSLDTPVTVGGGAMNFGGLAGLGAVGGGNQWFLLLGLVLVVALFLRGRR